MRGATSDGGERTGLERRLALLWIDVDDDRALAAHRPQDRDRHQPEPAGADHDHRLTRAHSGVELAKRAVGGDAGAGEGSRLLGRERAEAQEIPRVRYQDMVRISAGSVHAEEARLGTELLLAMVADCAFAATDPRMDQPPVAHFYAFGLGT